MRMTPGACGKDDTGPWWPRAVKAMQKQFKNVLCDNPLNCLYRIKFMKGILEHYEQTVQPHSSPIRTLTHPLRW
jgi:hypothetical protein